MLKYVPWNWLVYIRPRFLKLVPDDLKTQEMVKKTLKKRHGYCSMFLFASERRKCVVGLLENVYTLWELSLTILRHKKCVKKLLKKTYICWVISLIILKPKEDPWRLHTVPDRFKTKRMCEKAVEDEPKTLEYMPDDLKSGEICKEAVCREPYTWRYVPDHLKTEEMCEVVIHVRPKDFFLIPDRFKTQEMCIRAVKVDPWLLYDVPDWFVALQVMWCKDFDDSVYLIRWRNAYQKRKAQRVQI